MFNNALTKVISHHCIFTEALPSLIHRSFWLLSSLPRLRFSSPCGEFVAITFGKDEVLLRANGPIGSSGTVQGNIPLNALLYDVPKGKNLIYAASSFPKPCLLLSQLNI